MKLLNYNNIQNVSGRGSECTCICDEDKETQNVIYTYSDECEHMCCNDQGAQTWKYILSNSDIGRFGLCNDWPISQVMKNFDNLRLYDRNGEYIKSSKFFEK